MGREGDINLDINEDNQALSGNTNQSTDNDSERNTLERPSVRTGDLVSKSLDENDLERK